MTVFFLGKFMNRKMFNIADKEVENQVCMETAGFSIVKEDGVLKLFHRSML